MNATARTVPALLRAWLAIAILASIFSPASAQTVLPEPPRPHQPAAPPPADPAPPPSPKPPDEGLPSLDESLGLQDPTRKDAPSDPGSPTELDRQLRDEAPGDDFAQAVLLMGQVAGRLERDKDTGLATQRMQEEAMRRLDKLISDAKKQRQQQKQKQKQKQQQSQQDQPQNQQQKSQQKGQTSESQQQNQDNRGDVMDPAQRRGGSLRQVSPGGTAAWGSLPEHVRSSLMQGFSDQFSSMYQSMTEAYYRRLAEDRAKDRRSPSSPPATGGQR